MERDPDPQRKRDVRTYVIVIVIVAAVAAMVVLHLAGVVGPGSH